MLSEEGNYYTVGGWRGRGVRNEKGWRKKKRGRPTVLKSIKVQVGGQHPWWYKVSWRKAD